MLGGLAITSNAPPKPAPRTRRHSASDGKNETTIKLTKRQEETDPASKARSYVSPTGNVFDSTTTVQLSPKLRSRDNLGMDVSQTDVLPSAFSLPSMTSFGGMEIQCQTSHLETGKLDRLSPVSLDPSPVSANAKTCEIGQSVVNDVSLSSGRNSPIFIRDSNANVSVSKRVDVRQNDYVNVSISKPQPSVSPKPTRTPRTQNDRTENSMNHNAQKQVSSSASVQTKVLANKSKAERAKFEETINKALTSLPTLPAVSLKPKVFSIFMRVLLYTLHIANKFRKI